jgi:hypothetical protein
MRIIKNLLVYSFVTVLFLCCGKDSSIEHPVEPSAVGTLKADSSTQSCLPNTVVGNYIIDSSLNSSNYITATVNVTTIGAYTISTDSKNGYSFIGKGIFTNLGLNTVILYGTGKPVSAGINVFKVSFGGTTCYAIVTVTSSLPQAAYTLNCSGTTVNGTYTAGTALNSTNTISLPVSVTTIGAYSITTNTANGVSFAASGTFTTTGSQTITLNASGTPLVADTSTFKITAGANTCSQNITFAAPAPPSAYTFNCSGFLANGNYSFGNALTSSNTITASVNVTTLGAYNITSNSVNGISFSAAGTFTKLGAQNIILNGSGTPTSSGIANFTITGGGNTCSSISITISGPANAVFTFAGAPSACTSPTINGTYTAQTALSSSNTVVVQVNVTTVGAYSIQTGTVSGISFSASGTFTNTGTQNVTLSGTGTPTVAGSVSFTPTASGVTGCSFPVTISSGVVQPSPFSCKINGVYTDFSSSPSASTQNGLNLSGIDSADGSSLTIVLRLLSGSVHTGTYSSSSGSIVSGAYTDASMANWIGGVGSGSLTLVVTSLTSTNVQGTFSGTLIDGGQTKTITNGVFNLPL